MSALRDRNRMLAALRHRNGARPRPIPTGPFSWRDRDLLDRLVHRVLKAERDRTGR